MKDLSSLIGRLVKEDDGIVAVEYALVVAVISGLVAAALLLMDFTTIYTTVSTKVKGLVK